MGGSELAGATAKVIRRTPGEAIDIATRAGLVARVCVLDVGDDGSVSVVCVAPREVKFTPRTRQEAKRHARRRPA